MRTINARTGRESGIHSTTRGTGKFTSHLLTEQVQARLLTVEPKVRTACRLDPAIVSNADDPEFDCFLVHMGSTGGSGPVVHVGVDRHKGTGNDCEFCGRPV